MSGDSREKDGLSPVDAVTDERPELADKLSELEILRQSLEEAKNKERATYDQLLRLGAEFDNFRKRSEARIADAKRYGKEEVLTQILTLADALMHATASAEAATDLKGLKQGLQLIAQEFDRFLKAQGLTAIPAVGEKLDPNRHEAIAQEVNPDADDGLITAEIQRGYTLDGRLVRPSRVRVTVKQRTEESNHV